MRVPTGDHGVRPTGDPDAPGRPDPDTDRFRLRLRPPAGGNRGTGGTRPAAFRLYARVGRGSAADPGTRDVAQGVVALRDHTPAAVRPDPTTSPRQRGLTDASFGSGTGRCGRG